MDALDILTNLENVIPYFQPIYSADEHRITGYEVLGRYQTTDGVISLGPFFNDDHIPEEYRLEVDNLILMKALDKALGYDNDVMFFINRDANLLMLDHGEQFLQLLLSYEQKGLSLDRIILEIAEGNYQGKIDHLDHLLNYYRTFGIKIAVDKMGDESSHLDRVGQLAPDILKVDLSGLKFTENHQAFQDILYSLSLLARKIGATLLFENIEMSFQLQFAWRNGGRYYQGFYLGKPSEFFHDRNLLKDRLKKECEQFIFHEKKKLEKLYTISKGFHENVQQLMLKYRNCETYEQLLQSLVKEIGQKCFRLYICDENGFQLTSNLFKTKDGWVTQPDYFHKNWSWRPYFLENIIKMRYEKRGILSDLYSDIETAETIRTFSYPLNQTDYLFIDLPYSFLYEHDGLL